MRKQTKERMMMARPRNPNREEAKRKWLMSGGKISTAELAQSCGVKPYRIRKWKSEDGWKQELEKKSRGGQRGNTNAVGHGAPRRNKNAETHGAYAQVYLDQLSPEERAYIAGVTLDARENMLRELQLLLAKEGDLKRKMIEYERADSEQVYVDRVVEMFVPDKRTGGTPDQTAMKNVMKSSAFERWMKLEVAYNKTHGRILKLLDSIRAHEADNQRLALDERKHELAKQKMLGAYEIHPDIEEIEGDSVDGAVDEPRAK